ncbi:beta family protein [Acetobacter okinawensis]|uniref:beta family protein n=1 Tax=Acetobacter okinawensis TaxID=1076594 RepID=UPI00046EB68B|nr:beta family protein [Acetobacter okinawensis]
MHIPKSYVPLLRWRQGEYEALFRLGSAQKDSILPLIEVLKPDYDFEQRRPKRNLDEHLKLFGKRLDMKWNGLPALIDTSRLDPADRMADGRHPLAFIFDEARTVGAPLIPVTGLGRDVAYQTAVGAIAGADDRGAALRCSLAEALDPDFDNHIQGLLGTIGVHWTKLDIIIDLETPAFDPMPQLVNIIIAALSSATIFNACRSVTLLATSFPDTLANMTSPVQRFIRHEWILFKAVIAALPPGVRRPIFGDYGIAALTFAKGDMRFMRSSPNIRYTIDDAWIVARAKGGPRGSNLAYPVLCGLVTGSGAYLGSHFSAGSAYIANCQTGAATRGNPTTWKWVATNHHITKVLDDLSRLPLS